MRSRRRIEDRAAPARSAAAGRRARAGGERSGHARCAGRASVDPDAVGHLRREVAVDGVHGPRVAVQLVHGPPLGAGIWSSVAWDVGTPRSVTITTALARR